MAKVKKEVIKLDELPKTKNQLKFLKLLSNGEKTSEQLVVDAVALLYEKELPNIEKMISDAAGAE
jgi:hypothetical protein